VAVSAQTPRCTIQDDAGVSFRIDGDGIAVLYVQGVGAEVHRSFDSCDGKLLIMWRRGRKGAVQPQIHGDGTFVLDEVIFAGVIHYSPRPRHASGTTGARAD